MLKFVAPPIELVNLIEPFVNITISFPPADSKKALNNIFLKLKNHIETYSLDLERTLCPLFKYLNETLPSYKTRLFAIEYVCRSYFEAHKYPWANTLKIVSKCWPEWGIPWCFAADYECKIKDGDLWLARKYIETANRLMPLSDGFLFEVLDKFRKCFVKKKKLSKHISIKDKEDRALIKDNLLRANYLLVQNKPDIINISRLADTAKGVNSNEYLNVAVRIAFSIHGAEPYKWNVSEEFDDLYCAGSLCLLVNINAAKHGGKHDYLMWNKAAIHYLKRCLQVPCPKQKDKKIIAIDPLVRLGETYASMIAYNPEELLKEDVKSGVDQIKELAPRIAQLEKTSSYSLLRQLLRIYMSEALWAKNSGVPPKEISIAIKKAIDCFSSFIVFAYPNKQLRIVRDFIDFLIEFEHYERADQIAQQFRESWVNESKFCFELYEIASKFKSRSHKEAIKKLTQLLRASSNHRSILGYGYLLYYYCNAGLPSGIKMPYHIVENARREMRNKTAIFISAAANLIRWNEIEKAEKYVRAMKWAEEKNISSNIIHLAARINLLKIKKGEMTPDDALSEILQSFEEDPSLKDDEFILGAFLSTMSQGAAAPMDSNYVWHLATHPSRNLDPYNLTEALKWQVRSGQIDAWGDRVLSALRDFPGDRYIQHLPLFLWNNARLHAPDILVELFCKRIEQIEVDNGDDILINFLNSCDMVPGDFFFEKGVAARLLDQVNRCHKKNSYWERIVECIINGLTRGQISAWNRQSECQERTVKASELINHHLPQDYINKWTQWFGALRGEFERVITSRLQKDVEKLRDHLIQNFDSESWVSLLESFLNKYWILEDINVTKSISLPADWQEIEKFCVRASNSFAPDIVNKLYWKNLGTLVKEWVSTIPDKGKTDIMARAWLSLHRRLQKATLGRVIYVAMVQIHAFKNQIKDKQASQTLYEGLIKTIDKTIQFLNWHRWMDFEKVNLCEVLEQAAYSPLFCPTSRNDNSWIYKPKMYAIRPENPIWVQGNYDLLVELFRTLLENSSKAEVSLSAKSGGWIWARVFQEDDTAILEIIDNGKGASEAILDKMNDPSAKPFSTMKGTGYGTRLCHRIVGLHGGKLKFEIPERGTGMKVEIRFPSVKGVFKNGEL